MYEDETNFLLFVEVMKLHTTASHDPSVPIVKMNPAGSLPKYAVVNVSDIVHQVGLVKIPEKENYFYVIAPYIVFGSNLRINAGDIKHI